MYRRNRIQEFIERTMLNYVKATLYQHFMLTGNLFNNHYSWCMLSLAVITLSHRRGGFFYLFRYENWSGMETSNSYRLCI